MVRSHADRRVFAADARVLQSRLGTQMFQFCTCLITGQALSSRHHARARIAKLCPCRVAWPTARPPSFLRDVGSTWWCEESVDDATGRVHGAVVAEPERGVRGGENCVDLESHKVGVESGDLPRVGRVAQLGGDQATPGPLLAGQRIAYRAWLAVEDGQVRCPEAAAGEERFLRIGDPPVDPDAEPRGTWRLGPRGAGHGLLERFACGLGHCDLQVLLRAEQSLDASLAHPKVGGEPAEAESVKPV